MAGVSTLARSLLDLVFPPRCVNCHTLGALLCENCRATIAIPQTAALRALWSSIADAAI